MYIKHDPVVTLTYFMQGQHRSSMHVNGEIILSEKVQVGKDQEKAQSEKDSHSKNRGGKKPN